jgi:hypothetical protein
LEQSEAMRKKRALGKRRRRERRHQYRGDENHAKRRGPKHQCSSRVQKKGGNIGKKRGVIKGEGSKPLVTVPSQLHLPRQQFPLQPSLLSWHCYS